MSWSGVSLESGGVTEYKPGVVLREILIRFTQENVNTITNHRSLWISPVKSEGTRYFFLSSSGARDLEALSTMIY